MQVHIVRQQDLDFSWSQGNVNTKNTQLQWNVFFFYHYDNSFLPSLASHTQYCSKQISTATWAVTASQTERTTDAEQRCLQTHLAGHRDCGTKEYKQYLSFFSWLLIKKLGWKIKTAWLCNYFVLNRCRGVVMKPTTVTSAYLCCAIDKVIKNNDSLLSAQKRIF